MHRQKDPNRRDRVVGVSGRRLVMKRSSLLRMSQRMLPTERLFAYVGLRACNCELCSYAVDPSLRMSLVSLLPAIVIAD
jgi:hypothetical protein